MRVSVTNRLTFIMIILLSSTLLFNLSVKAESTRTKVKQIQNPLIIMTSKRSLSFVSSSLLSSSSSSLSSSQVASRKQMLWSKSEKSASAIQSVQTKNSYWINHLNNPKHIMAPMVAQSDLPFRILCRKYETDLCFTQMIHSSNFIRSTAFQKNHLDIYSTSKSKLHITESGWNILQDFDWKRFEQTCTFLQQQQTKNQNSENFMDQNLIYNLIQTCQKDHHQFLTSNGEYDQHLYYGQYYEGLPTINHEQQVNKSSKKSNNKKNPIIVQLAGHDPKIMTQAAQTILSLTNNNNSDDNNDDIVQYNGQVSGFDINCGCPQAIARKGNYGAFLMESDFQAVCNTIQELKRNLPLNIGVSVKMRIPPEYAMSESKGYNILKSRINAMVDSGVDLITLHGRTLHENKTKVRHCNWNAISDATSISKHGDCIIPIVANGGIETYQDVIECMDKTNADAVMSSESLLENPGLFIPSLSSDLQSPQEIFYQQIHYCHEYLDLCVLFPPLPGALGKKGGSFNVIRSHLFKMLYRYLEEQTDLRTLLAHPKKMTSIQSARNLVNELESRYRDVMDVEVEKLGRKHGGRQYSWADLTSSNRNSSWYRRHRNAIANNKMNIRGAKDTENNSMSIEEKKQAMMLRITKLREQKMEREKQKITN